MKYTLRGPDNNGGAGAFTFPKTDEIILDKVMCQKMIQFAHVISFCGKLFCENNNYVHKLAAFASHCRTII